MATGTITLWQCPSIERGSVSRILLGHFIAFSMSTQTNLRTGHSLPTAFIDVARMLFWFGVLWFALGNFITFVPGGEQSWFGIGAVLVAFGLFVPQRRYRLAAVVLLLLSVIAQFDSHKRGIEYRKYLEQRRTTAPSWHQP